jgi:hypothetical protein
MWVESVRKEPGLVEVQTRLQVISQGRRGDLVVEGEPAHLAYGLPIAWALLLAAGGPGRVAKLLMAYIMLLPAQAFCLTMDLLRKMVTAIPGGARAMGVDQWQLGAIALGYQLGTLMVPTLVPIVLWLWLDKAFAKRLVTL